MSDQLGSQRPFQDVQLSIASYALDVTVGKRRLRAIDQDGTLIYEDEKRPEIKFTEQLERIWNEYPNGLLDVTEEQLARLPPDDPAVRVVTKDQVENTASDASKTMTWDEMEKLRSEVYSQLNEARNELWFVLELAKTLNLSGDFTADPPAILAPGLAPQAKKAKKAAKPEDVKPALSQNALVKGTQIDPPILPPGSYSATPNAPPSRPPHTEALELELALAAKQRALEECEGLIDAAVEELQAMAAAGEQFWSNVRALRSGENGRGQWAIVPKPDFGRVPATGESARDVIIPYAVDEAPPALRARSLAAFDLDPQKKDALTFGARSHLRLRVTHHDGLQTTSSSLASGAADEGDERKLMDVVQVEAFEEELFNEIRGEASRMTNCVVEPRSFRTSVDGEEVTFDMCDPRDAQVSHPTSSTCDLLLMAARLGLTRFHRRRKNRLIYPNHGQLSAAISPDSPSRAILAPILQVLRHRTTTRKLTATLAMFSATLQRCDLDATVESHYAISEDAGQEFLMGLLAGEDGVEALGGVFGLRVKGCRGISIAATVKAPSMITTSIAHFALDDIDDLSQIVAEDLSAQLLSLAVDILREELDEDLQERIFLDEMERCVDLGRLGTLSIALNAPFDSMSAQVQSPSTDHQIEGYDSRSGVGLKDWLAALAVRVAASLNDA